MTDDQRQSRGVPEGGTPGLASVHELFSGRAGESPERANAAARRPTPDRRTADVADRSAEESLLSRVVSLDGSKLSPQDLRDMIAQKEAEWRAGSEVGDRSSGAGSRENRSRSNEEPGQGTSRRSSGLRRTKGLRRSGSVRPDSSGVDDAPQEMAQPAWSTPDWAVRNPAAKASDPIGPEGTEPPEAHAVSETSARRPDDRGRRRERGGAQRPGRSLDRVGQPEPDATGSAGRTGDPQEEAREIVLKQLSAGAKTRAQLSRVLAQKGIPADVGKAVLDRFEEVDLVDDAAFSRQYVENRRTGRGLARRALSHELQQKGVAAETAREAVESVTADDELATARQLVRKRAAGMTGDDPERRMRRLAGMLARKGYGPGTAYRAIREELADLGVEGTFGAPDPD